MKLRLTFAIPIAVVGILTLASPARAQRGVGAKPGLTGMTGGRSGLAVRGVIRSTPPLRSFFRSRGKGWGIGPGWGWGGFVPYLGYDAYWNNQDFGDYGAPGYPPVPGPPPPVVMEGSQPERVIQPVLLERQGDQWVKITGYAEASITAPPEPSVANETSHLRVVSPSSNQAREAEVPPAVLVFRDGHQEEVKSYTIIGDTLYAHANYWISGTWTKKIEISTLDVPATLKLNEERGSNFRLPSGPQEVMIRP